MRVEIKWVIIIFIVHLLWFVGERFLGLYSEHFGWQELSAWVFLAVYAGMMYLALSNLRSSNNGLLNRRHGFLSGFFISLVLVALTPVLVGLLSIVIQPGFFAIMIEHALETGEYSAYELAEQQFSYWSYVKLFMAGYLLVGSLSGALWSYLLHKMPDPVTE